MLSIKPVPSMPKEFRIIILFYLVFLLLLITFQTKIGVESATPAFKMPGSEGSNECRPDRLQDWQSVMDHRLNSVFKKQAIVVEETSWVLREKTGLEPLRWTTTEFRIRWDDKHPFKEFLTFQKSLDDKVKEFGGERLSANVCKMNGITYYRFDYGVFWGGQHLITHRLYITIPEFYSNDMKRLGFSFQARSRQISPKPHLESIGLTSKRQLIANDQARTKEKPGSKIKEVTADLKREDALPSTVILPKKTRVAIIIDDFGFVKEPGEAYFRIHAPLTIAVLPGGLYSKEHALRAAKSGFEVLLHQPLEPLNMGRNNPGPGVISGNDSEDRIKEEFESNLMQVPGAVGFNNHMGSAGTQDRRLMGILMNEAKRDGLFFIDSRSIANTVGEEAARKAGVLHAGRRVFLDNEIGDIRKQLDLLKSIALRDGEAIGIAHARPGVAQAIEEYLPEFARAGIKIVHVSELVHQ